MGSLRRVLLRISATRTSENPYRPAGRSLVAGHGGLGPEWDRCSEVADRNPGALKRCHRPERSCSACKVAKASVFQKPSTRKRVLRGFVSRKNSRTISSIAETPSRTSRPSATSYEQGLEEGPTASLPGTFNDWASSSHERACKTTTSKRDVEVLRLPPGASQEASSRSLISSSLHASRERQTIPDEMSFDNHFTSVPRRAKSSG